MQTQTQGADPRLVQVVGGAIVDSLERPTMLLAARRTAPPAFAGLWEFPGGKVEDGESAEDGLRRELGEELGIAVALGPEVPGPLPQGWPLNDRAAMREIFRILRPGGFAILSAPINATRQYTYENPAITAAATRATPGWVELAAASPRPLHHPLGA